MGRTPLVSGDIVMKKYIIVLLLFALLLPLFCSACADQSLSFQFFPSRPTDSDPNLTPVSDPNTTPVSDPGQIPVPDPNQSPTTSAPAPDPNHNLNPDMKWDVKTDYSGLTPYQPLHNAYSRLSDGPLPELIPSDRYGMLLPYEGAYAASEYSGLQVMKYGLVTAGGLVVTDAVYDYAARAYGYASYYLNTAKPLAAYMLGIDLPQEEGQWYRDRIFAACALDGSWITPFDYVSIYFYEDVIVLQRDYSETYDIDVYNYNGELLYNFLDMDWRRDLADPGNYGFWLGGGDVSKASVIMKNGVAAYIDLPTGTLQATQYDYAGPFAEGLAPVYITAPSSGRSLYGYINMNYDLVIKCSFDYVEQFIDGKALVYAQGGGTQLIDKQGKVLLSVTNGWIERHYDGNGFSVYDNSVSNNLNYRHYSNDIKEIRPPSGYGDISSAYYMGGGWYIGDFADQTLYPSNGDNGARLLFSKDAEYLFTDIYYISTIAGGYVAYTKILETSAGLSPGAKPQTASFRGVMTLDGREVIPPGQEADISFVKDGDTVTAFIVNTGASAYYGGPVVASTPRYRLVGVDGATIASGAGSLRYDDATGLFAITSEESFGYIDIDGNVIAFIPIMSYMFD